MSKSKLALIVSATMLSLLIWKWESIVPAFYYFSKTDNKTEVEFYLEVLSNKDQLASALKNAGVIQSDRAFKALFDYKNLDSSKIALGKYRIEPGTSIRALLNGFTKNSAGNGNSEVEIELTIGNARFVPDLVGKIARKLMADSAQIMTSLQNPERLRRLNISEDQLHTLLIPNTYRMFYDTDADDFVARMEEEYLSFWSEERLKKLREVGLQSPVEAVTLASIVYSEQQKVPDEWPTIAGLYLNRIRNGIALQSDPTFKYCWGTELDTVKRLLAIHRNIACAYNTYLHVGLPPGPICIPPIATVDAVLNPTNHPYLFMVATPDYTGRHYFSDNYSEHQREANRYQKWLSAELKENQ